MGDFVVVYLLKDISTLFIEINSIIILPVIRDLSFFRTNKKKILFLTRFKRNGGGRREGEREKAGEFKISNFFSLPLISFVKIDVR